MHLVIKDTLNRVHVIDISKTRENTAGEVEDADVVVSLCTRDVVSPISEAEEFDGKEFERVEGYCPDCRRALQRLPEAKA